MSVNRSPPTPGRNGTPVKDDEGRLKHLAMAARGMSISGEKDWALGPLSPAGRDRCIFRKDNWGEVALPHRSGLPSSPGPTMARMVKRLPGLSCSPDDQNPERGQQG